MSDETREKIEANRDGLEALAKSDLPASRVAKSILSQIED